MRKEEKGIEECKINRKKKLNDTSEVKGKEKRRKGNRRIRNKQKKKKAK